MYFLCAEDAIDGLTLGTWIIIWKYCTTNLLWLLVPPLAGGDRVLSSFNSTVVALFSTILNASKFESWTIHCNSGDCCQSGICLSIAKKYDSFCKLTGNGMVLAGNFCMTGKTTVAMQILFVFALIHILSYKAAPYILLRCLLEAWWKLRFSTSCYMSLAGAGSTDKNKHHQKCILVKHAPSVL